MYIVYAGQRMNPWFKLMDNMYIERHKMTSLFHSLVDAYSERTYWLVRRLVINHEDTNKIVREIWTTVYRSLGRYNVHVEGYTWIGKITIDHSIKFLRNQQKSLSSSPEQYVEQKTNADHTFSGDKDQVLLMKSIHRLPEKQRLTFLLKFFEKMSYIEVAEILSLSTSSVKAHYPLAIDKVKRYFYTGLDCSWPEQRFIHLLEEKPFLVPKDYTTTLEDELKCISNQRPYRPLHRFLVPLSIVVSTLILGAVLTLFDSPPPSGGWEEVSRLDLFLYIDEHIYDYSWKDLCADSLEVTCAPYTFNTDTSLQDLNPFESQVVETSITLD